MKLKSLKWLAVLIAALAFVSCKSEQAKSKGKLNVVTTATMVTDLLKNVGGDKVEVHGLIKEGVDPHHYEETSSDVKKRNNADAIFYVGLHFESNFEKPFEAMAEQGKNVFALGEAIDKSKLRKLTDGQYDCHVWGDVDHMITMTDAAVAGLSKADSQNAKYYEEQGAAYKKELEELKVWIAKRVAEIPEGQRKLVTSHDAFDYFASAYGFEVASLKGVSTVADTKPDDLNRVVEFVKKNNIKVVFSENATSEKGVGLVADAAGIGVSKNKLAADSTGKLGEIVEVNGEKYDKGTYIGMVKHNVNSIVEGLK